MRWLAFLALLSVVACGKDPKPVLPTAQQPAPAGKPALLLEHDFGVIPHGETRTHEFVMDLGKLDAPYVPLRVHLDCSCGHADLRLRAADGSERFVANTGLSGDRPGPGETLLLHVEIDSAKKEAIDLPRTASRGFVVLQLLDDTSGASRIQWPLLVHFAIDAPVVLRPLATLDFDRVPLSGRGHLVTTLRGDERHAGATFGPVTSSDDSVALELVEEADHWLLRATCTPKELGHFRAAVHVKTSIPDYRLELAATWKVVPDLEVVPMAKVSVRASLGREQTEKEALGQYVVLHDHDVRRAPEFSVSRCVDDAGRDLSAHFAITLAAIDSGKRPQRLHVRYRGGLAEGVRGQIVLTKDGERGPFLPIELVVFAIP